MKRPHAARVACAAVLVMVTSACGSTVKPGQGSTTRTTLPAARLDLASAAGVGAVAPSAGAAAPAIYPMRPTRYVLDGKLPDLGPSGVVWRMNAHTVSGSDVQRFASALGVVGSPARTPGGWEVRDTKAILTFFVSDGTVEVSYAFGVPSATVGSTAGSVGSAGAATPGSAATNRATKAAPPPPPPVPAAKVSPAVPAQGTIPAEPRIPSPVDVPNAADAQTIARTLLDRLGVLTGQHWVTDVNITGGVAISCAAGSVCPSVPPEVFARTVTFSLILDGASVHSVNWSVTIGEHRRVQSLNGEWASPSPLGSYPLLATLSAFDDLQHGTARYSGPQPMTALGAPAIATRPNLPSLTVHITAVTLGLARWNGYEHGHTVVDLVPTYLFHERIDDASSYDIEVLALTPNAVTFTNPIPTSKPLPVPPAPQPIARPRAAIK
jgi:hypothetical protein